MKLRAPTRPLVAGSTLLMVVALGVLALATAPKQAASGASISAKCPKGEPAGKCLHVEPPGYTIPSELPQTVGTVPPPFWPSPTTVSCGQGFLATTTASALEAQFGTYSCFRFSGQRTWVLSFNGESTTVSPVVSSPGGAAVALDACATGDSTCMDANTQHPLSAWTIYYPPGPQALGAKLEGVFGGRSIYTFGLCGAFDFINHVWMSNPTHSRINSYLNGAPGLTVAAPAPAPAPVPATKAVTRPTPPRTNSC